MISTLSTSTQREALLQTCAIGRTSKLQELLHTSQEHGQDHDAQPSASLESSLITAMLTKATQNNHPDTVRYILTLLPRMKIPEEIVRWALLSCSIEMYKTLFTHDPSIIHMIIRDGRETQLGKALSIPASPEHIAFLISCGLKPSNDPFDASPLGLACGRWQTRSVELCTILLQHGASLLHSGALAAAAKIGRIEVVSWLLEQGADVNDIVTKAALITHPCKGHPWPALHAAIESGHLEVVRLLLDRGADPELLDEKGRTAYAVAKAGRDQQMISLLGVAVRGKAEPGSENTLGIRPDFVIT